MGFIKKDKEKKEETDSAEKIEYPFPEDAELKACRYCQVMIPKKAKVCPNCRKRLKKNWLGIFLLLCLLAACAAGVYYYVAVYSAAGQVASAESVQSGEAGQDAEEGLMPEEGAAEESGSEEGNGLAEAETETAGTDGAGTDITVQIENLPVIPAALDGAADAEASKNGQEGDSGNESKAGQEDGAGNESETDQKDGSAETAGADQEGKDKEESEAGKEGEDKKESEAGKEGEDKKEPEADKEDKDQEESEAGDEEDSEKAAADGKGLGAEGEDAENAQDRAGMAEVGDADGKTESDTELADGVVIIGDRSIYTEEEFRNACQQIDYKKLLRGQELYLNAAVTEELFVLEQVDGGLFDENVYYLCQKEDEQGIMRYYIIRDDRGEDGEPILEGDMLRVYGQLFGSCKLPGYLVRTQPVVPALTLEYYDILSE